MVSWASVGELNSIIPIIKNYEKKINKSNFNNDNYTSSYEVFKNLI